MSTLPVHTNAQKFAALAEANRRRAERARFKAQLRRLEVPQAQRMVAALIDRPPDWAASWRVADVLRCIPRRGVVWASKLCRCVQCAESKRLSGLTPRQRAEFVWGLNGSQEP